jgi:hypothetical protein
MKARYEPFLTDVSAYLTEELRQDLEFRATVVFGRLTLVKGLK